MKVCYVTEMGFSEKIPDYMPNMSVLFVEMSGLDADHINITEIQKHPEILKNYDACVFIYPKSNPLALNLTKVIKEHTKLVLHQEGPRDFWYDWTPEQQKLLLNAFELCDLFMANNWCDLMFFEQFMPGKVMYSPVSFHPRSIEENNTNTQQEKVLVPGNMCKWYGGLSSYTVVKDSGLDVTIPSMGRRQENEDVLVNPAQVSYLPFLEFDDWVKVVSTHKYMVHLMDAVGGGNVCLIASAMGIPCIGNELWDTQKKCQPLLAIPNWNLTQAKELFTRLRTDPEFYAECSRQAKENAYHYFTRDVVGKYHKEEFQRRLAL